MRNELTTPRKNKQMQTTFPNCPIMEISAPGNIMIRQRNNQISENCGSVFDYPSSRYISTDTQRCVQHASTPAILSFRRLTFIPLFFIFSFDLRFFPLFSSFLSPVLPSISLGCVHLGNRMLRDTLCIGPVATKKQATRALID